MIPQDSPLNRPDQQDPFKGAKDSLSKIGNMKIVKDTKKGLSSLGESIRPGVEAGADIMKTAWNFWSDMIGKLEVKKYLAPIMASLTGMLAWLSGEKKKEITAKANDSEEEIVPKKINKNVVEKKPAQSTEELRVQLEAERKAKESAPRLFDPDVLQHWDVPKGKDMTTKDASEYRKLYPDQLVGFYKSESGWTQCSGSGLLNVKLLSRLSGGKKKLIVPAQNVNDIEKIKAALKSNNDKDKKIKLTDGAYDLTGLTKTDLIPRGDADKVEIFYNRMQINKISGSPKDILRGLDLSGKTLCDLVTHGSTKYGHRSAAIKTEAGWFVIDPYRGYKGQHSTKPIPLMDYMEGTEDGVKKRKHGTEVRFAVPIDTSKA